MRKAKYLFFGIIISLTGLSVLGENNFGSGFGFSLDDNQPKITQREVKDLVHQDLIKPMTECYVEANPEVMMTKCAPYMRFDFASQWGQEIDKDTKFYANQDIEGAIILDDCGQQSHVCSVKINFSKESKLSAQESFFTEWVSAEEYIESFCSKIWKIVE